MNQWGSSWILWEIFGAKIARNLTQLVGEDRFQV